MHKVCIIQLVHTWCIIQKSARDADLHACLHHFCIKSACFCKKYASSLHFHQPPVVPRTTGGSFADYVQNTCRLCRLGADLMHTFVKKVIECGFSVHQYRRRTPYGKSFCRVSSASLLWCRASSPQVCSVPAPCTCDTPAGTC